MRLKNLSVFKPIHLRVFSAPQATQYFWRRNKCYGKKSGVHSKVSQSSILFFVTDKQKVGLQGFEP